MAGGSCVNLSEQLDSFYHLYSLKRHFATLQDRDSCIRETEHTVSDGYLEMA